MHGFCDASESAKTGVVYMRTADSDECVHVTLVIAKTKVAPIKRLTIPHLELHGALILSKLLCHCKVFDVPWLPNPRRSLSPNLPYTAIASANREVR